MAGEEGNGLSLTEVEESVVADGGGEMVGEEEEQNSLIDGPLLTEEDVEVVVLRPVAGGEGDDYLAGVYRLLSTEDELLYDTLQALTHDRCDACQCRFRVGRLVYIAFPCLHAVHEGFCENIWAEDSRRIRYCSRCRGVITHLSPTSTVPYPEIGSPVVSDEDSDEDNDELIDPASVRFVSPVRPSSPPRCRSCQSFFIVGQRVRMIMLCGHQYCENDCWPNVYQSSMCGQCNQSFGDNDHYGEYFFPGDNLLEEQFPATPEFQTDPSTGVITFTSPPIQAVSANLDEEQILDDIRDAFGL